MARQVRVEEPYSEKKIIFRMVSETPSRGSGANVTASS